MASSIESRYDLAALIAIVDKHAYTRVVLQFPDEELEYCVPVYDFLTTTFPSTTEIYVTADSTWGSSIDDVSAMHCDGDVLAYFGTDLSSSGTIPVIIVPPRKPIDIAHCLESVKASAKSLSDAKIENIALFYEPGYVSACQQLSEPLAFLGNVELAALPVQADLQNWRPQLGKTQKNTNTSEETTERVVVGGLLVSRSLLDNKSTVIVYVGDKPEQIVNILLRVSENTVLHYSPADTSAPLRVLKGTESREFRERYGGVLRVKDAHIVGIIVGSMGLTGELTKEILHRLQTLIRAAHKRYYCFVMGRLNEAKLCNFPEVDVFCLVSNEDNANIKPKTFHKPVVTPFELELGLGAREWGSTFSTDLGALVGNGAEDLRAAVARVQEENPYDGDSDTDDQGVLGGNFIEGIDYSTEGADSTTNGTGDEAAGATNDASGACGDGASKADCGCSGAVVKHGINVGSGQLTVFHSPAAEYLQNREFKGLIRAVGEDASMEIMQGQYGVAADYAVHGAHSVAKGSREGVN